MPPHRKEQHVAGTTPADPRRHHVNQVMQQGTEIQLSRPAKILRILTTPTESISHGWDFDGVNVSPSTRSKVASADLSGAANVRAEGVRRSALTADDLLSDRTCGLQCAYGL